MPTSVFQHRFFATWCGAVLLGILVGCASPAATVTPPALAPGYGLFVPPEPPSGYHAHTIRFANQDMVAAANPLAVQAGVAILAQGGSAVDAAIAVQMVLNLVEPQSSGIGGGAFLLHFDQMAGKVLAYDGRETAPQAADPDMFLGADGKPLGFLHAVDGGLSVGTPGVLRMLETAHKTHGKLPWNTLFAPAISLAENGFALSERLNVLIASTKARIQAQGGPVASYFLNADGSAKATGTWLKNPELANTFRAIANGGADVFYTGQMAQDIVAKVNHHPTRPGRLSLADLQGYSPKVREPVCGNYRLSYRVCGMPAPSSGGITLLQTLGLLNHFDLAGMQPNSADSVHLMSEAYRLAYADRARYIADPDFVTVPTVGLLAPDYLAQRASLIHMQKSMGVPTAGLPAGATSAKGADTSANLPSTSHISIVDRAGNAVAMTTTIENGFGSLQMVRGFLLNNQLTDFSFTAKDAQGQQVANRVEPLKRPRSAMAPTFMFNAKTGALEGITGSPGGSAIIQYTTKTVVGLVDWQLDVQQAINLPNFGAQTDATTSLEKGSVIDTAALREALVARGHTVVQTTAFTSGLHAITFNGQRADGTPGLLARHPGAGVYAGGADPRREGTAQGN